MIIPIRCFTCNNVIANKYIKYYKLKKKYSEKNNDQLDIIDLNNPDKSQVKMKNYRGPGNCILGSRTFWGQAGRPAGHPPPGQTDQTRQIQSFRLKKLNNNKIKTQHNKNTKKTTQTNNTNIKIK